MGKTFDELVRSQWLRTMTADAVKSIAEHNMPRLTYTVGFLAGLEVAYRLFGLQEDTEGLQEDAERLRELRTAIVNLAAARSR